MELIPFFVVLGIKPRLRENFRAVIRINFIANAPFLFVGGDVTRIASTLLMMTLLVALYHLMPFGPMDGKAIYKWSKMALIATLVPLFIIYYYLFLL